MESARRVYNWASQKALSPWAPLWLAFIFLLEMFLFLPMDALLMLFCMNDPKRRYIYALVATLSSVVMGLIGYGIGYLLWDSIGNFVIDHLVSENFFNRLLEHYNKHKYMAVFLGSFLPIPFKVITISAGFCQLSLGNYLSALFLARGLRFFLIAEIVQRWGAKIQGFVDRHFNSLVIVIGAKVLLTLAFFWVLGT